MYEVCYTSFESITFEATRETAIMMTGINLISLAFLGCSPLLISGNISESAVKTRLHVEHALPQDIDPNQKSPLGINVSP